MENGSTVSVKPFFSKKAYDAFYQSGNFFSKIAAITNSCITRFLLLFQLSPFDFVFIHREAAPVGPPVIEWVIAKIARKRIIYDFDDAIWLTDKSGESVLTQMIRWRKKVRAICKWSYRVSCGNKYLADYARQFNPNTIVNPTTLDTVHLHVPDNTRIADDKITIGWTGSRSTLKYLKSILPVLQVLSRNHPHLRFLVIADKNPMLKLANLEFRPWARETEITDLAAIDIGIMPMPDDAWTRGKCGFKALQYMAMGIPAVVSPVGVNTEIVRQGEEGFLCTSFEEWFTRLEELIMDDNKRREMGRRGRQRVIDHYSVAANTSCFLSLFQ